MSLQKTPLQVVKDKYGDKGSLVDILVKKLEAPTGEDEDSFRARLKSASNRKLVRLLARAEALAGHGGRDKLVSTVAEAQGRTKDADYVKKLGGHTIGRLLDLAGRARSSEASSVQTADAKRKIRAAKTSSRTAKAEARTENKKSVARRVLAQKTPKRRSKK